VILAALLALAAAATPGKQAAAVANTPRAAPRAVAPWGAPRALPSPAGPGAAEPGLATDPDGRVWLSWLEPGPPGGHRLRCASWSGQRWSAAHTIAEGESLFANSADVPSLLPLPGGRLLAHWLWRIGSDPYAYEVRLSQSDDGGSGWSRAVRAHRDASSAEHGFVSMALAADGVSVAWLDGRKGAGMPEGTAETELRTGQLTARGSVVGEQPIDSRVCDCCPTAAVAVPGAILVAYRDRSASEVRDIALVRRAGGRWSAPYPLHADGWTIAGCPVNGPALAASGNRVVAAWFTGAAQAPRVLAAFSEDGGLHFGAPVVVDRRAPLGRVQALMLPDGSALVAWLGSAAAPGRGRSDAALLAARVSATGRVGSAVRIGGTAAGRASGIPRMALACDAVLFAWTEAAPAGPGAATSAPTAIRIATLSLGGRLDVPR
jgi:hypothetical protein